MPTEPNKEPQNQEFFMRITALLCCTVLLLLAFPAIAGELFLWIDDEGVFHLTNAAPRLIVFQTNKVFVWQSETAIRSAQLASTPVEDRLQEGASFWEQQEEKRKAYEEALNSSHKRETGIGVRTAVLGQEIRQLRLERRRLTLKKAHGELRSREYKQEWEGIEAQIMAKTAEIDQLRAEKDRLLRDREGLWRQFHQ